MTAQLHIDDLAPYLPHLSESGLGGGTADSWCPPERVWVPADELPVEHCEICNGSDVAHDGSPGCGSCRGGARPLAPGDRVPLVTDCPNCIGQGNLREEANPASDHLVEYLFCRTCEAPGVVRVGSATIAEIVDVVDYGQHNTVGVYIVRGDQTGAPIWVDNRSFPINASEVLPGDWSSARFGVRLSDVEDER